jgi:hypothetical protein
MLSTKEELALQVDEAEWGWLRAHLERGGVIVVAPGLDLVEAGQAIAADDASAVSAWIEAGLLAKPEREQIAVWDATEGKRLRTLIISPYVLIQEREQQSKEVYQ